MTERRWGRVRKSVQHWRDRDQIIDDMQRGLYTHKQTMERLAAHSQPGGAERDHVFSCRNGWMPCRCPFKFDRQNLVSLVG